MSAVVAIHPPLRRGRFSDLTGRRYGRLTVREHVGTAEIGRTGVTPAHFAEYTASA
jgi:hypothetical protein